jgi:hypothetical protein
MNDGHVALAAPHCDPAACSNSSASICLAKWCQCIKPLGSSAAREGAQARREGALAASLSRPAP